jgi:hypothetical protein
MLRPLLIAAVLLSLPTGLASLPADQAAQPADALKTCLTDNTSGRDRKDLAKWIFLAMAAHPELKQYAGPSTVEATDESSRMMASLIMRLLTQSCLAETQAVVRSSQGSETLSQSFRIAFESLGKLAMQELMNDKDVQGSMAQFEHHFDQKRFVEALAGK